MKERLKAKMNNVSIRTKVFFYFILLLSLLLLIIWLFQIVFLENLFEYTRETQVKSSVERIIKAVNNDEDAKDFQLLINELAVSNALCIELQSAKGEVIYAKEYLEKCVVHDNGGWNTKNIFDQLDETEDELILHYKIDAQGEIIFASLRFETNQGKAMLLSENKYLQKVLVDEKIISNPKAGSDTKKEEQHTKEEQYTKAMTYVKKINDDKGKPFVLVINSILSPRTATVSAIKSEFFLVAALMTIVSLLLAFMISKRISKPIAEINESVKQLGIGYYGVDFHTKGYKEINELSETLNYVTEELGKVEELRKELLVNVSHDLRAPLTLIGGYAELIRDFPDENLASSVQVIIDEASRLSGLITEVLDLSALESGFMNLMFSTFDITKKLSDVTTRVAHFLKNEGYTIEFIYTQRVKVRADEARIEQAFYNILMNAVNFTGEDKTVIVKQIIEKDFVKVEVTDSGRGMKPEQEKHIWDRNYTEKKMSTKVTSGTGIGLSLVKSIIELHGGTYGTHSNHGKGTVVWFSIAIAEDGNESQS